jgi:hypothetical protein
MNYSTYSTLIHQITYILTSPVGMNIWNHQKLSIIMTILTEQKLSTTMLTKPLPWHDRVSTTSTKRQDMNYCQ